MDCLVILLLSQKVFDGGRNGVLYGEVSREVGEYRKTRKSKKEQISDFLMMRKSGMDYVWSKEIIPINEQ